MKYPALILDEKKLKHNIDTVVDWCHKADVQCFVVTKVTCAHPAVVSLVDKSETDGFADSRLENLESINTSKPKLMLRIGSPSEVDRVVSASNISLQSNIDSIIMLQKAASKICTIHKIILMIDLGDLREGIFFEDRQAILAAAKAIADSPNLDLYGIGTNLTCYGAILPDKENLGELVELAKWLRSELNIPIPIISGGNSSSLDMLRRNILPNGINHLRIGEAIMLGQDTANCVHIPELFDDAFTLAAELIEIQKKPSKPIGTSYKNAFGEAVVYEDVGMQIRGILAVGRQDVAIDGLMPIDKTITILGGSSDHLLVNLTNSKKYHVNDIIRFKLSYGALLAASTSKYVHKQ